MFNHRRITVLEEQVCTLQSRLDGMTAKKKRGRPAKTYTELKKVAKAAYMRKWYAKNKAKKV